MGSFDIASTGGNNHLASNVNSNELGIQPHTYFNLYLGHSYTSSNRTFNNDDRTMLIDSLKHVQLFGDLSTQGDEPAISIQNTGTSGNDTTKLNYKDKWGQIHTQLRTQLKDDSQGGSYDSAFHIKTAANGTLATRIAIKEDGNVGIGSESADNLLHLKTSVAHTAKMKIETTASDSYPTISFKNDAQEYAIYAPNGTAADSFMIYDENNSSARLVIATSGNIGIGTTYPNGTLHIGSASAVGSEANPAFQIGSTGNYRFGVYTTGEGAIVENKNGDDGVRFVVKTAGEAMRVTGGTGYVGVGTDNPQYPFHVAGAPAGNYVSVIHSTHATDGYGLLIKAGDDNNVRNLTCRDKDNGALFSVNGGGNVGIGDESPSYKLEVAGTFYASGSSANFKKNVTDLAVDSSSIYNLNPVSYNYKKDYEDFGYDLAEGKQFGLISEEVAESVPELAIMKDGEPKNVDYQKLSVLLLAEMQKMNKRIKDLENA